MDTNHLAVRRPSYFRSPSDTVVVLADMEDRRLPVPALASLAVLDHRRHSTPLNAEFPFPDVRPQPLNRWYSAGDSRRSSILPLHSPSLSETGSVHRSEHGTPTDSTVTATGQRTPVSTYIPSGIAPTAGRGLLGLLVDAYRDVRLRALDVALISAVVGLALWNAVLALRVGTLRRAPVYNDRQLEDALIALDNGPRWRTEL